MSRLNLLTAAALSAIILATTNVKAADMPVYYEEPVFGGWYLRGDIGASHQRVDSVTNLLYDGPVVDSWVSYNDDFEASWFMGIGVGYQFNEWFRADITGEYRAKSDYDGLHGFDTNADDIVDLLDDYDTDKSEWTFLANIYWDITTWHSITPFVGIGVGASYNKIHDLVDYNPLSPDGPSANCPGGGNGCADSNGEWQFAWALHAGLAFAVAPNIAIEIAYRYLNLGDASSSNLVPSGAGPDPTDNPMEFNDLDSHDIKIGLRYTLN